MASDIVIGAHVEQTDPVAEAAGPRGRPGAVLPRRPAGLQGPGDPLRRAAPTALRQAAEEAGVDLYVHAPYIVNVATTNNRIRIPSRKLLQQHMDAAAAIGAKGLIVHGGHVEQGRRPREGLRQLAQGRRGDRHQGPAADREHRRRRQRDDPPPRPDRRASGTRSRRPRASRRSASASTPATRTPAASSWPTVVEKVVPITGRIDLVHANDSRDDVRLRRRPARQLRPRPLRRGRLRRRGPRGGGPGGLRDPRRGGRAPGRLRLAARARRLSGGQPL